MTTLQPLNQKHFFSQHTISSFAFILFLLLAFIIFSRIPFNEPLTVKRFIAKQQRLTTVSNSTQLTCSPNTQSQENACAYVEEMILKGICPESPYLRLLYCHLTYSHPVFYILMVCSIQRNLYFLGNMAINDVLYSSKHFKELFLPFSFQNFKLSSTYPKYCGKMIPIIE